MRKLLILICGLCAYGWTTSAPDVEGPPYWWVWVKEIANSWTFRLIVLGLIVVALAVTIIFHKRKAG